MTWFSLDDATMSERADDLEAGCGIANAERDHIDDAASSRYVAGKYRPDRSAERGPFQPKEVL